MIEEILKKERFRIKVKANSAKTRIIGSDNDCVLMEIAAPAEKNKANMEIIKFLSKKLDRKVRITSGLKSKTKTIEVTTR